jgi:hypothetical protein
MRVIVTPEIGAELTRKCAIHVRISVRSNGKRGKGVLLSTGPLQSDHKSSEEREKDTTVSFIRKDKYWPQVV